MVDHLETHGAGEGLERRCSEAGGERNDTAGECRQRCGDGGVVGRCRSAQTGVISLEAGPGKGLAGGKGQAVPSAALVRDGALVVLPCEDEHADVVRLPQVALAVLVPAVHDAVVVDPGSVAVGVIVAGLDAVFDESKADRRGERVVRRQLHRDGAVSGDNAGTEDDLFSTGKRELHITDAAIRRRCRRVERTPHRAGVAVVAGPGVGAGIVAVRVDAAQEPVAVEVAVAHDVQLVVRLDVADGRGPAEEVGRIERVRHRQDLTRGGDAGVEIRDAIGKVDLRAGDAAAGIGTGHILPARLAWIEGAVEVSRVEGGELQCHFAGLSATVLNRVRREGRVDDLIHAGVVEAGRVIDGDEVTGVDAGRLVRGAGSVLRK